VPISAELYISFPNERYIQTERGGGGVERSDPGGMLMLYYCLDFRLQMCCWIQDE